MTGRREYPLMPKMKRVLKYYGGILKMAKYLGVSHTAIIKMNRLKMITADMAIRIERDSLGKFRAMYLYGPDREVVKPLEKDDET
jgi:hypothetical protein